MSDPADKTGSSMINVIDEFDYSTQSDSYNEKFRKWRRKKENPFAFSFEMNRNESVFVDGKGFVSHSAAESEREVLQRIFFEIGTAALIWLLVDTVISKLVIFGLSALGVHVHTTFFSSAIYGGRAEIVTVLIAMAAAKVVLPSIYLHFRFKLPTRVEIMNSLSSPSGLLGAIAMTLLLCAATSIPAAYSGESKEIYEFFRSLETDVSVWGQREFLVYTVFDILVLTVLSELFLRGAMFAVLRQFGDVFAIIMTSLTAGLMTMNAREMPIAIMVSIVASYGMLRSGSIFTAFFVSTLYKMYQLALNIIELDPTEKMYLNRNFFILAVSIAGAVGLLAFWLINRKKGRGLAVYKSEQSLEKRCVNSIRVFPYSIVAAITVVYSIVKAVLS